LVFKDVLKADGIHFDYKKYYIYSLLWLSR